jgi:Cft2 family RNA processing exonuclease
LFARARKLADRQPTCAHLAAGRGDNSRVSFSKKSMHLTNLTRHIEIGANCYLLEIAGKRIVLDSGMHPKQEGLAAQPDFSLLADDSVDAIILSHSHQDHCGTLPVLMRHQPHARIFMSEPTRHLANIMLHNSVNVMTKKREELGIPTYPLFTHRELDKVTARWEAKPLRQPFGIDGERLGKNEQTDISIEFFDAGHILGAVGTLIRAEGRSVFYTGDVNFENQTLSQAAQFPEEPLDVLITECTRGDYAQPPGFTREGESRRLAKAIGTAFERGGCVLMPLFALGKTQEMLAMFYEFRRQGLLAKCPIYIGGLGTKLTEIYDKLAHAYPRLRPDLQLLDAVAPFVIAGRQADPPIAAGRIYSISSGMMTEKTLSNSFARRIISQPQHSLFFVGYSDPQSPAGKIKATPHGGDVVLDPDHEPQKLLCHVEQFTFSGHATRETICTYIKRVTPKKTILVHGDQPAIDWMHDTLAAALPASEIIKPQPGVQFEF